MGLGHDFGERGHRANLDAVAGHANASELGDAAQIDDRLRPLDPILQPVEAVHAASQHPRVGSVVLEQLLCIRDGRWLKQLEGGHDVSYDSHCDLLTSTSGRYPPKKY